MSEDKLREQFEVWYEADSMPSESNWFKRDDQYPDEYHYLATQISWGGFQSCAKIKDAEIAGLTKQRNAYKTADDARNKLIDWKVETGVKEKTKELDSLSSERDVNAILTVEIEQLNAKVAMMSEAIKEIWYSNSTQIEETKFYEIIKATEADVTKWVNGIRANAVVEYLIQVQEAREAHTLRGE
jgi:hypothetical protein